MDDDILNSIKKLHINNTEEGKELMTIVCEGKKLICDKEILLKECDYFKALERFEKKSNEIELKGEIDFDVLEIIINYLSKGQQLPIDLNNFQNILQGFKICLVFTKFQPSRQRTLSHFVNIKLIVFRSWKALIWIISKISCVIIVMS